MRIINYPLMPNNKQKIQRSNNNIKMNFLSSDKFTPSFKGKEEDTLFLDYISSDEELCKKKIEGYLRAGADINAKDDDGETALHILLDNAKFNMIDFLVKKGADINAQNKNGDTILYASARKFYAEDMEFLLDKGADPNIKCGGGKTVLFLSASLFDVDKVDVLLKHGAKVDILDDNNQNALNVLFNSIPDEKGFAEDWDSQREYLELKKYLFAITKKMLAKNKALPYQSDLNELRPPEQAIRKNLTKTLRLFLNNGFDVDSLNPKTKEGLLIHSIFADKNDIFKFLVEDRKANIHKEDIFGNNLLNIASMQHSTEILNYLIEKGLKFKPNKNKETALHTALYDFSGNTKEMTERLIDLELNVNARDKQGRTPLHYLYKAAASKAHEELTYEGSMIENSDEEKQNKLIEFMRPFEEIEKVLTAENAKMNARDKNGKTPAEYKKIISTALQTGKSEKLENIFDEEDDDDNSEEIN